MENRLDYRYNVMNINSPQAFMSVRGGCTGQLRDVYFVRVLGINASIGNIVTGIDDNAQKEAAAGRMDYIRLEGLPKLIKEEDAAYYSDEYDKWKKKSAPLVLKNISLNTDLQNIISEALMKTDEIYRNNKIMVSDSIMRNFQTKILFWLDCISNDILCNWNNKRSIKVIAQNIAKEQEYLFFFFLTRIGCDVMLLQTAMDVNVSDKLKKLSNSIVLGNFGAVKFKEYKKHNILNIQNAHEEDNKNSKRADRDENIDKHAIQDSSGNKQKKNAPGTQDWQMHQELNTRKHQDFVMQKNENETSEKETKCKDNEAAFMDRTQRKMPDNALHMADKCLDAEKEKSFEEIACLASSIVMISVYESDGEAKSSGSGIMIGKDGYILTNFHVIEGGSFYSVRIEDDDEIYATNELIKYNQELDMAIIRINRKLNPLCIYDGKKKLVRGQKVVAIGSPLGLFNSVSDGIISGFRTIRDEDMIQFTAPISPGSSGGAVLNMQGELIGISTAGIGSGQNINLAVGYENILLFTKGFR